MTEKDPAEARRDLFGVSLVQESAGRLLRDELSISEYRRRVYEYVYTHYESVA